MCFVVRAEIPLVDLQVRPKRARSEEESSNDPRTTKRTKKILTGSNEERRGTIEQMNAVAQKRGGQCLSTEYKNCRSKLVWKCRKGHVFEMVPNDVKNHGHWCPHCAGNKKKSIADMQKLADERGGKCLSEKYINTETKLCWECSEGHIFMMRPMNVRQGQWCAQCSGRKKYKLKDLHDLAATKGGRCLCTSYSNATTPVPWMCAAGHQFVLSVVDVTKKRQWCTSCAEGKEATTASSPHTSATVSPPSTEIAPFPTNQMRAVQYPMPVAAAVPNNEIAANAAVFQPPLQPVVQPTVSAAPVVFNAPPPRRAVAVPEASPAARHPMMHYASSPAMLHSAMRSPVHAPVHRVDSGSGNAGVVWLTPNRAPAVLPPEYLQRTATPLADVRHVHPNSPAQWFHTPAGMTRVVTPDSGQFAIPVTVDMRGMSPYPNMAVPFANGQMRGRGEPYTDSPGHPGHRY